MLKVENISKGYNIDTNEWTRILTNLGFRKQKENETFWALKNINFDIREGETVGILGKNGSGKSTLLQVIAGTLKPSSGKVIKPKKVAALLELGAGFNPEFSGHDNIFLNGALIGMTQKEIKSRYNDILNFAEIGDFINRPVKTYSSGMFARLAFAIAVHSKPDLLIVDEALSVGDTAFQEKSINRMKELRDSGVPIFFVSHSIPMVRNFCTRAIWINKGEIKMDGEAKTVCREYLAFLQPNLLSDSKEVIKLTPQDPSIIFENIELSSKNIHVGDTLKIKCKFKRFKETRDGYGVGVIIFNKKEEIVSIVSTVRDDILINKLPNEIELNIPFIALSAGEYTFSISLTDDLSTFHYDRYDNFSKIQVDNIYNNKGLPKYEGIIGLEHEWKFK
ncbi:TPA: ABC transporter ATP-binding protein [Photobacterium damselae]